MHTYILYIYKHMHSNVGSIFRTAETAGVSLVVTCGITCHPPHPKLSKTALSSLDSVPTIHFESTAEGVQYLRSQGYSIVAMETTERSETYSDVVFPSRVALVVGNEVTGVDVRIIEAADRVVQIPTYGKHSAYRLLTIFVPRDLYLLTMCLPCA